MFHLSFTKLCRLRVGPSEVFKSSIFINCVGVHKCWNKWFARANSALNLEIETLLSGTPFWGPTKYDFFFDFQLAEYRQRKAYADSQRKQKKKKKKKSAEDPEGDSQERVEVCVGGEESSGAGQDGSQEENKEPPSSEFTFTRVLQSGETVKHRQNYTIEVGR